MKQEIPTPAADAAGEIAALIGTLHQAGERLEELTGGEVDSVTDHGGRPFLLRRAQEQLRHTVADKQAAVLNALPAYIALLDARGMIVSVNDAWRKFDAGNPAQGPGYAVGLNYPEICNNVRGNDAAEAHQVAAGIRSVLNGEAGSFSLEYPSQPATERRWLQMTVTPLPGENRNGAVVMHMDVTERKRAEEEQRAVRQLLDNIVENIPTAVQLKSVQDDFRILMWNKAAEEMYGLPREAAIGRNVRDLWPDADAERMHAADLDLIAGGRMQDFPDRLAKTKNRGDIRVHMRKVALLDARGNATHVLVIADDITVRKEADEQIKRGLEALRRFSAAMDATADAIYLVDRASMGFIHVNEAACRMQGRTRDELLALGPTGVLSIPRAELERSYDAVIASGVDAEPLEMLRTRENGSQVWVELRRHAQLSGDRWTIVTLVRDVTDRKKAAQELRESESRFRSLTKLSSDWFWEQDENHAFVKFVGGDTVDGWGPDQSKAVGQHRWDLVGAIPISCSWEEHRRTLDAHKPFRHFEYKRILGNGALQYVEASGEPVFDDGGRFIGYRGVATEITARKQAAEKLESERGRLVAAQRVAKIGSWETDLATLSATWSDETHRIHETDPATFHPTHQRFLEFVHPEDRARVDEAFRRCLEQPAACTIEHRLLLPDGRIKFLEERWQSFADDQGTPLRAIGTCQDITDRKLAERRIERLNRVYAMLSGINTAIVRNQTRDELFREVCRIALSEGHFTLARVVELDASGQARVAATTETDSLVFQRIVDEYNTNPDHSQSLLALGLRNGKPMISNDVANDPRMPNRAALTKDGTFAFALLPIIVDQHVAGAVTLRAREAGMFDDAELRLLVEVVANLSFALEHIAKEAKVRKLTRVYRVLSGINALIVRARSRDELFREACRVAVDAGTFAMAWIGVVDRAAMKIEPIASAGVEAEFLDLIKDRFSLLEDSPSGNTMSARAVRDKKAIVANDMQKGPGFFFVKERLERGILSIAVLPLIVADEAVGVLALYADEADFFDEDEMRLLTELAGDIAFAIDHIAKRDRLDYLAFYDELTGLANRNLLLERLAQYMRSAISGGKKLVLFFLDIERFRNINESVGRTAGDAILRQVSDYLSKTAGNPNLLARLGPDQFGIVVPEVSQEDNVAQQLESKIRRFTEHTFQVNGAGMRISVRVGVAMFPNDGTDAATLLRNAEAAMKKAKARGQPYLFYKSKMNDSMAGKLSLENQLREALDQEQFVLHYQPKVNLESGKLTSAEALIRWNDPRTGLVPPGRFIPALEETGLIQDVGRWALRQAIQDYLRWRAAGLPALRIAVNVSPLQLRNRGFIDEIRQVVGVDPHAAEGLELEITESLIMDDVEHNIASLKAIRDLGVTIAIDDFGTGFSSLSYLARLPVDTLKIDRSFVNAMALSAEGLSLVSTIISLAHSLKLKVVAEGVETEEQSRLLRLMRCNEMQGFLFSKPVPADVYESKFLVPAPAPEAPSPRSGGRQDGLG